MWDKSDPTLGRTSARQKWTSHRAEALAKLRMDAAPGQCHRAAAGRAWRGGDPAAGGSLAGVVHGEGRVPPLKGWSFWAAASTPPVISVRQMRFSRYPGGMSECRIAASSYSGAAMLPPRSTTRTKATGDMAKLATRPYGQASHSTTGSSKVTNSLAPTRAKLLRYSVKLYDMKITVEPA